MLVVTLPEPLFGSFAKITQKIPIVAISPLRIQTTNS